MLDPLRLHQGPGLNGLFVNAAPLSREYDADSNMTSYTLRSNYTLHIRGNYLEHPARLLLKSETLKLLDMLVCKLGDSRASCGVELPLEEFLTLAGYPITEANKNAVRPRLQEHTALLGLLSMDWTEGDGRYIHRNVKLFDEINYRNGGVCAIFGEPMALYLRNCPSMPLPLPLLATGVRAPHMYFLGRRCLLHRAINKGQDRSLSVGSLLDACPSIPRPAPEKEWPPSVLERKVIAPFEAAMKTLADNGILPPWKFREPVCRNDYEGFANSMVEFQTTNDTAPTLSAESSESKEWHDSFNYDAFLAIR